MSTLQTGAHYPISTKALPASWDVGYVGDFALEIQPGFASGKHNKEGQGIPHIRPYNIDRLGKLDLATIKYVAPEADAKRLHSGDVLFNNTNSPELIGKTSVVSAAGNWGFSNHMTRIVFSEDVSPRFAAYQLHYLWMTGYFLHNCVKHVNQASVSSKTLARSVPFVKPPRPQQERIVAEIEKQFSRLDEAVANLKRVKANLKRYKAAVLKAAVEGKLTEEWRKQHADSGPVVQLFERPPTSNAATKRRAGRLWGSGTVPELTNEERLSVPSTWRWLKVRELGPNLDDTVQVGPMSMKSSEFAEGGVPVLNVGCVQWGHIDESKLDHLPPQKAAAFARYTIRENDILFTRSGTVGRCAIAGERHNGWLMTFHLLRVRPDTRKCLPEFLRAVFEGAAHIRRQTRHAAIGTTRAGFNTNLLADLDVPLPPYKEQAQIASEIAQGTSLIESLEATVQASLKRAERLRQSVLSHVFSGSRVLFDRKSA